MSSDGMTNESTNCQNFNTIATSKNISATTSDYISIYNNNDLIIQLKANNSGIMKIVYLGSNSVDITTTQTTDRQLDSNNIYWNK